MLTLGEDPEGIMAAMAAGARGFLVKDASLEEMTVMVGMATAAASGPGARVLPMPAREGPGAPQLSEREVEVLDGMARGRSNAQIGRELYLSEDTIKTHARRLFRKLEVADRAQAVAVGFRTGLLA
jgi:DNA-binding NarL/FixJ family response regulator